MEQNRSTPPHGKEEEAADEEGACDAADTPPYAVSDLGVARDLGIDEAEAMLLLTLGC
ncbi:MAG TPA: hypothetical protein VIN61_08340 [Gammaproteobacteria bacterium]